MASFWDFLFFSFYFWVFFFFPHLQCFVILLLKLLMFRHAHIACFHRLLSRPSHKEGRSLLPWEQTRINASFIALLLSSRLAALILSSCVALRNCNSRSRLACAIPSSAFSLSLRSFILWIHLLTDCPHFYPSFDNSM